METTRIDRWLWAVRLCKTRSAATDACRGGHIKINGVHAKAATQLHVGDRVEARLAQRDRIVEVTQLIDKRVGASVAAACFIDHSPPPPERAAAPMFDRDRGAGRPTKRDRRTLNRLRGR